MVEKNYTVYAHITPSEKMYFGITGINGYKHKWRYEGLW